MINTKVDEYPYSPLEKPHLPRCGFSPFMMGGLLEMDHTSLPESNKKVLPYPNGRTFYYADGENQLFLM